jgi:sugar/nucleoside kinase (ribokinase family)
MKKTSTFDIVIANAHNCTVSVTLDVPDMVRFLEPAEVHQVWSDVWSAVRLSLVEEPELVTLKSVENGDYKEGHVVGLKCAECRTVHFVHSSQVSEVEIGTEVSDWLNWYCHWCA